MHLTRNGDAFVFQIRIPRRLDPGLTLSPIRLTLGAMPNSQARPLATALAGLAQMEFARRANALMTGPATALRDEVSHSLQAAMPILLGLGALKPGALSPSVQDKAIAAVFDALGEIGRQRAGGAGAFAREDIRFEKPFVEALRSENGARDLLGMPRLGGTAIDRVEQTMSAMAERLNGLEQNLLSRIGPAPGEWRGPLFSEAADKAIAAKIETHGADCSDISGLRLRGNIFIKLIGDRPVDSYTNADMQRFANHLSWMPANLTKQQDFDLEHLEEIIDANKARKGAGLAANTILSYIGRVRTIIIKACNSVAGLQHSVSELPKVPIHAAQPKVRLAPDKNEIGKVIAAGVASGILSDALLPPLAILTGRRIGLLTFLRREQILRYNDTWCVFPVGTQQVDGVVTRVPAKTAASLGYYVLHDFFEECGFIAWAKKANGPVFKHLMAAKDPADAAQKRMGRLYKSAGVDPAIAGTFHGLRSGKIRQERSRATSGRALRIQVGHSVHDEHDGYDPVMTDEELQHFAQAPLPAGVEWCRLHGVDFEAYARKVPKGGRPKK